MLTALEQIQDVDPPPDILVPESHVASMQHNSVHVHLIAGDDHRTIRQIRGSATPRTVPLALVDPFETTFRAAIENYCGQFGRVVR